MNIRAIRIVTGEDIIGDCNVDAARRTINIIIKPAIIGIQQGPNGKQQLGLADYLPFAKTKTIEINSEMIVYFYEPTPELINAYNMNFGNGLFLLNMGLTI